MSRDQRRRRSSRIIIATLLFLAVSLETKPSLTSIPVDRPVPPTPQEVGALVDLSRWVLGGSTDPGFHAFDGVPVASAIAANRPAFELFRRYPDDELRNRCLRHIPFGELIASSARRYAVDPLLLASMVEAESGFDPKALSADGAIGLMQILPSTAALYSSGDPREPAVNLDVGARYLRGLLRRFDGNLTLALAAYNAGPGNVSRYAGLPPFRETRRYVDRVLSRYVDYNRSLWYESPQRGWLFQ